MKLELKLALEKAIDKTLNDCAEDQLWGRYIHPSLVSQMVNAAEAVFDSAQDAQDYFEQEEPTKK